LLKRLKPSSIADHKYHLESKEEQRVRREVCTPGTRVRMLDDIITWAKNTSPGSPNVYWLFGQAGSGKSTIAYSVARRFEFGGDPNDTIILGGNFFCSRQTRLSKCIIRTVVHHLALKCRAFADQLSHADFGTVNQDVRTQLEELLIAPWQASKPDRCSDPLNPPPHYLIVIDALDEIDGTGGSKFLRGLLEVIDKNENRLQGLKFFVTSRPDPNLVGPVDSLKSKQLYCLQHVLPEEAQKDVRAYLTANLPHIAGWEEFEKLVALTGGLFIYAATIVKSLVRSGHSEQKSFLTTLLASSNSSNLQSLSTGMAFTSLRMLYSQILDEAFRDFSPKEKGWEVRRSILHTFLCTAERTSTSVVADLLFTSDYTDVAEKLLSDLHAVLYCGERGQVLTYHKSFSDFILDQGRSDNFWCDQAIHHRVLADACFRCMKDGLRFNIANIPSSFVLDVDNHMLADAVKENILPVLSYSSRNWSYHLSAAASIIPDGLHDSISDFLRLRALFWIEVMNLLCLRGLCGSMLQTVHDWVISSQVSFLSFEYPVTDLLCHLGQVVISKKLTEVRSFAIYFSGSSASSSTPHLYISALATWPRNLNPCRHWKSHFPRIPGFINASLGGTLLTTLNVHSRVMAVAVSPDGKQIVSGLSDNSVRVWDASTGDELKAMKGHTDLVRSVAISPDGKQIVSGSNDKSVRVWDVSTGDELKVLKGHAHMVISVAFSPDGKQIVSGSYDKSVRVWDVSMGDKLKVLKYHADLVRSVAFSPDGKQIVSGSYDKSVRVWDVSMGDKLKVLKYHADLVRSVAFSPDGKQIVSGSGNNSVQVWDFGSLYIHETISDSNNHEKHTGWILSPDGQHRLMFVPPELLLPDASNILTIPRSSCSSVDFTHSALGPQWKQCYHP
jgi:WD40 repeat protein